MVRIVQFTEALCNLGPNSNKFSLEVHHGGFFCGQGVNKTYVDGKVTYEDDIEAELWCYLWIEDLLLQLDYVIGKVKVYWLLPDKQLHDGLRILESDVETLVMK